MKSNKEFKVLKDIPLKEGGVIREGTLITRTHGVYYMEGALLPEDYQDDFDDLIEEESESGWKYICPVKTKEKFKV